MWQDPELDISAGKIQKESRHDTPGKEERAKGSVGEEKITFGAAKHEFQRKC